MPATPVFEELSALSGKITSQFEDLWIEKEEYGKILITSGTASPRIWDAMTKLQDSERAQKSARGAISVTLVTFTVAKAYCCKLAL